MPRGKLRWTLCAGLALYAAAAFLLAAVKSPWSDEGWFANPAYNLAFRGFMGTDVLEPSGHYLNAYLTGIHQHTYVVPPVHILELAGWYRLFGFGVLSMRALSIAWGGVALVALYFLVAKLVNSTVGVLAVCLGACDFPFLWGAADGRMDVPCMAVCLTALAIYVVWREPRFDQAFIAANALFAIAFLMHPNALIAFCGFAFIVLSQDRSRLRWRILAAAAAPYLLGLAAWSVYILQDPTDFRIQFLANAAGRNSVRMAGIVQPWMAIWNEVIVRYLSFYGFYAVWISGGVTRWMLVAPAIYVTALLALSTRRDIRRDCRQRTLLQLIAVYFFTMAFFIGFKAQGYLVYIVLLYDAAVAFWTWRLWRSSNVGRWMAAVVMTLFVAVNGYMVGLKVVENGYRDEYLACANYLRTVVRPGQSIYATAGLGFTIPYERFTDDGRLGFYTHRTADYILVDRSYSQWMTIFRLDEPVVYAYIQDLFTREYRVAYQSGSYKVYQRLHSRPKT